MKPNIKYTHFIPLVIITLSVTILYSISEGVFSLFLFWTLGLILPINYFRRVFKEDKRLLISLFSVAYCLYTLYMYVTNYIYVEYPDRDVFVALDSINYWNLANVKITNWNEFISACNTRYAGSFYIFNVINIIIVYICNLVDHSTLLVLKLQCVWLGAFSIPFLYLILNKYLKKDRAFKFARLYSLLSLTPFFSILLLRDIHVYFFYVIGIYILSNWQSEKNGILKLCLIELLLLGLRLEHGLFFLLFIFSFVYLKIRKNIVLVIGGGLLGVVVVLVLSSSIINTYMTTTETYEELRNSRTGESTSRMMDKLPVGIKQVALGVNSQVAPAVPFWRTWYIKLSTINNYMRFNLIGYYTPWRFMEGVGGIFNLFIWGFIIAGFRRKDIRGYLLKKKELLYLFVISLLLLLLATSDINVRRIFCVYPILYLIGMVFYDGLSSKVRRVVIRNSFLTVCILHLLWLVIK